MLANYEDYSIQEITKDFNEIINQMNTVEDMNQLYELKHLQSQLSELVYQYNISRIKELEGR